MGSKVKQSIQDYLKEMEQKVSNLQFELQEVGAILSEEKEKRQFYQMIADFTFAWELWFAPDSKIIYCSPSCFDLTGYTSNQIITSEGIAPLLIYEPDRSKYIAFIKGSLEQMLINHSLEFRLLTRTKQLRWCMINVRGVYDKQGLYLGIRATIQDITRLKRAMGQIREIESGKIHEQRTQKRIQNELEIKDRELVTFLLQLSQKNELLSKIAAQLNTIGKKGLLKNKEWKELSNLLMKEPQIRPDWNMIEKQLDRTYPGFLTRLKIKHPLITEKDKKLCVYLRLGLTSKEISGLQNIAPKSVEIARVRLRKKLKIPEKTRLYNYLEQM